MSDTPDHPSDLPRTQAASEDPVARLSALWRHGQKPDLREFLAGAGQLSAAELTDVLCTDQHERWMDGQRPAVEAYFELHGSFHPGSAPPIDLILGEFLRDASWASPRPRTSTASDSPTSRSSCGCISTSTTPWGMLCRRRTIPQSGLEWILPQSPTRPGRLPAATSGKRRPRCEAQKPGHGTPITSHSSACCRTWPGSSRRPHFFR